MAPGISVKLGVLHQGQEKTVTVTLGTLPNEKAAANQEKSGATPDNDMPKLGLTLAPSNKMSGGEGSGVVVTAVDPSGVAADHGFQVGECDPGCRRQVGLQPVGCPQATRGRPQGR